MSVVILNKVGSKHTHMHSPTVYLGSLPHSQAISSASFPGHLIGNGLGMRQSDLSSWWDLVDGLGTRPRVT